VRLLHMNTVPEMRSSQRRTTSTTRLRPRHNLSYHMFSDSMVYSLHLYEIELIPCQASAFASFIQRGSVILRGISLLGYVLCSQQTTVITPDEFEDYSLELLVEPVRGANSSTGQQTIAAPTTEDYRKPSLRPVPRVHSSPHPDADVLALDRHHNGGKRGDQVQQESKLNFNLLYKFKMTDDGKSQ